MRYRDGQPVRVGDVVSIDLRHQGTVVACIEDGTYLHPLNKEQWTHLRQGVLIETSISGLVHYPDQAALEAAQVELLRQQT